MDMVPSQNDKQNHHTSANNYVYGCNTTASFGGTAASAMNHPFEVEGYNCLGSDFVVSHTHMAEDESRTLTNTSTHNEAEAGSTSKEEAELVGGSSSSWLQLSIGCQSDHTAATTTTTKHGRGDQAGSLMGPTGSGSIVELDLLPGGHHGRHSRAGLDHQPAMFPMAEIRGSARAAVMMSCQGGSSFGANSLLFEQGASMSMASGPPMSHPSWAIGPLLHHNSMPSSSSSSSSYSSSQSCSSLMRPLGSYFPTPFHHQYFPAGAGFEFDHVAGPSSDVSVRVVDPPRRPHSGIWFMLQASNNQAKEPFLPQIPKSYLRIKDGRMTVRLLLKYLVNKLKLESESEIEITCRGQQLLPFLTLQHVRDTIWTPRDTARTLLSESSTTDHVMVLHYGRSA